MIVVTGGAGFIGSNLVHALNTRGRSDVLVIDDLSDGHKCANLADARIADYLDREEARRLLESGAELGLALDQVFHLGACSDTTQWDGRLMMRENYAFSRLLLHYCTARGIPFVYASSAAVYGTGRAFAEIARNEHPLNVYGYSKLAFDQHVRGRAGHGNSLVVGLRYFNVYGPREQHKGGMASVAWHLHQQLVAGDRVQLFDASHGCAAGEQRRDFIYVDDAVDVTLWSAALPAAASGIYNCGSGRAESFNAVAAAVLAWHGRGSIEYVPMPAALIPAYQAYTEADLSRLRALGFRGDLRPVADGVRAYLDWLAAR